MDRFQGVHETTPKTSMMQDHVLLRTLEIPLALLTKSANSCRRRLMLNAGNMRLSGSAQWRVALAVVFFLVSSLQGTLVASAGSFGQMNAKTAAHHEMVVDAASDHHHGQAADSAAPAEKKHHGGESVADKGCEVHCAPASAVPVDTGKIMHAVARCFAQSVAAVLIDGNYAEFIRPPRHLI